MIKLETLFLILIFFISCKDARKSETQSLENNLKTYFKSKIDSSSAIDSFHLVKLDTISQFNLILEQNEILTKQYRALVDLLRKNTQDLQSKGDQLRLYRMLNSSELMDVQKREVDECIEKSGLIKKEIDTVSKVVDKLIKDMASADTIHPIGYQASVFYQIRNKDMSVIRDTGVIMLNLNKDIIDRKEFTKLPYTVDLEKLD